MILGFKEFLDTKKQKPTYFKEKILDRHVWTMPFQKLPDDAPYPNGYIMGSLKFPNKLHTIRADSHDRWKAGRSIQMVYRGAGYKIKDKFNEGIPELEKCVSTQKIKFKWKKKSVSIFIDGTLKCFIKASYDLDIDKVVPECSYEHQQFIRTLSMNDGFDHVREFLAWFNKDFTGKIIHWSDLKY